MHSSFSVSLAVSGARAGNQVDGLDAQEGSHATHHYPDLLSHELANGDLEVSDDDSWDAAS